MNTDALIGTAGLALAAVLAGVAIDGRAGPVGRVVVGLAAFTTAKAAIDRFYAAADRP